MPGAIAIGTGLHAEVLGEFLAHSTGIGLTVTAFQVGDNAFERVRAAEAGAARGTVDKLHVFFASVQQYVLRVLRE